MKNAYIPAFFVHGKDDIFITQKHSEDLYAAYSGEKKIRLVDGYLFIFIQRSQSGTTLIDSIRNINLLLLWFVRWGTCERRKGVYWVAKDGEE